MSEVRCYLAGRLTLERSGRLLMESEFPSPQARLAFVYLALHHGRPVSRDQLARALWGDVDRPPAWDAALSALTSKLKARLRQRGFGDLGIESRFGCLTLVMPADGWLDLEAAAQASDEAEGHLRHEQPRLAWGPANVAVCIARQPFLPDEEREWVEARRRQLRAVLARGLVCLSRVSLALGEAPLAIQHAEEFVDLEPLRDQSYQHLMQVHAALGNRGEALRVYAACRSRLRDELGVDPSSESEALYLRILRA